MALAHQYKLEEINVEMEWMLRIENLKKSADNASEQNQVTGRIIQSQIAAEAKIATSSKTA